MSLDHDVVVLDGALATELSRRGFELRAPLFAARALFDAPELVQAIHADYIRAGAQVITTDSFGLHPRTLAEAGIAERFDELVGRCVALIDAARRDAAIEDRNRKGWAKVRIAGSLPPLVREREAERGDEPSELRVHEQRRLAKALVDAGVDLLLSETHIGLDTIDIALEAVAPLEVPVWLGVVAGLPTTDSTFPLADLPPGLPPSAIATQRPDGSRLLGGETFQALIRRIDRAPRLDALLINCTQIDAVPAALEALHAAVAKSSRPDLPLGLYPHLGKRSWDGTWIEQIIESEAFAEQMHAWLRARPDFALAGACCGSTPQYIAALARWLQADDAARSRSFVRLAELVP